MKYVCLRSSYTAIYGKVKMNNKDNYRDIVWEKGVVPKKSRIKKDRYHLYEWI